MWESEQFTFHNRCIIGKSEWFYALLTCKYSLENENYTVLTNAQVMMSIQLRLHEANPCSHVHVSHLLGDGICCPFCNYNETGNLLVDEWGNEGIWLTNTILLSCDYCYILFQYIVTHIIYIDIIKIFKISFKSKFI